MAVACGGAQVAPPRHCTEGDRQQIDCSSEVSYQGIDAHGSLSALGSIQTSGQFHDVAIRRVNDNVAQYIAAQTRLCRDYDACAIDANTYHSESAKTRDLLLGATDLAGKVARAHSDTEQLHLFDKLYTSIVPETQRAEELTFQMAVEAQLPPWAGGGVLNIAPLQPLPTNSHVAFAFRSSSDAYLYIFQINASGDVVALFPDERIGTSNPLRAGVMTRVPAQGQSFRLNEKDLGTERVYVVASRRDVGILKAAVARINSQQVSQVGQDTMLAKLATVKPAGDSDCHGTGTRGLELDTAPAAPEPGKCTRTRGLVLETADGSVSTNKPSLSARTAPGDDTIVKVFPFTHVTEPAYEQARQAFQSPQGVRERDMFGGD